jgi:hypothetical protein
MAEIGKLNESDALLFARGKYFCTTADVWGVCSKNCSSTAEHWDAFWRKEGVSIEVRPTEGSFLLDSYKITLDAVKAGSGPAPRKSTRSESTGSNAGSSVWKKDIIWPVDVVGNRARKEHQVAHLLPSGVTVHEEWFGVAAAVLGLPKTASVKEQLMAVRGVKIENSEQNDDGQKLPAVRSPPPPRMSNDNIPPSSNLKRTRSNSAVQALPAGTDCITPPPVETRTNTAKKSRPVVAFDGSVTSGNSQDTRSSRSSVARKQRVDHTGVIHFVSNKIRMRLHGTVLDGRTPTMLIVPCMTLKEANGWRGEGYKAVVLTGLPQGVSNMSQDYVNQAPDAAESFKAAGMITEGFQQRFEESPQIGDEEKMRLLANARQGLEETVLAFTEYVKGIGEKDLSDLQEGNRHILTQRSGSLGSQVLVPESLSAVPKKPVLFLDFGTVDSKDIHPAPDPELLLAKASVVWGKMNGVTILANGETTDDSECDSLDELAEELFCDQFRSGLTPIPNEISVVSPGLLSKCS